MDYDASSVMKSAVNWSFKDTQLRFYESATMEFGSYMLAAQGVAIEGDEIVRKKRFIAMFLAYHSTVLNGFSAYLNTTGEKDEYIKDFPSEQYRFTDQDFYYENMFNSDKAKLVKMCRVLFYWSQQYGPFATLTKHIDPGDSWALG
jgi:hypothetical protein